MARPNSWSGFDGRGGSSGYGIDGGPWADMVAQGSARNADRYTDAVNKASSWTKWGLNSMAQAGAQGIENMATFGNFGLGLQGDQMKHDASMWAANEEAKAIKKAQEGDTAGDVFGTIAGVAKSFVPFVG